MLSRRLFLLGVVATTVFRPRPRPKPVAAKYANTYSNTY